MFKMIIFFKQMFKDQHDPEIQRPLKRIKVNKGKLLTLA